MKEVHLSGLVSTLSFIITFRVGPRACFVRCCIQALAASGLRALRYAKEVDQVGSVVACDNDKGITRIDKLHVKVQSGMYEGSCQEHLELRMVTLPEG